MCVRRKCRLDARVMLHRIRDTTVTNAALAGTNVLRVNSLFTEYASEHGTVVKAAQDVSFEVPEGKLFTLLGPSGCGKTTTLRSIAGLEKPTSGEIEVGGRTVYSSSRGIFVATN